MSFRHLNYHDRLQIEILLKAKHTVIEVAQLIGCTRQTIYNEIEIGECEQIDSEFRIYTVYSARVAQDYHDAAATAKGPAVKLAKDHAFANYVRNRINRDGWSPAAVLGYIKEHNLKFDTKVCVTTLYSYIHAGYLGRIDLKHYNLKKKNEEDEPKAKMVVPMDKSIHSRPLEALQRLPGHWEMDTVIGKKSTRSCLLVLTERHSRYELITKIPDKTALSVAGALRSLRRAGFRPLTVTSDNGSEFRAKCVVDALAPAPLFFADPYCAWQRGSNENCNRLIRRFFPKGCSFDQVSPAEVQQCQDWINSYPRKILQYRSASDVFEKTITTHISKQARPCEVRG